MPVGTNSPLVDHPLADRDPDELWGGDGDWAHLTVAEVEAQIEAILDEVYSQPLTPEQDEAFWRFTLATLRPKRIEADELPVPDHASKSAKLVGRAIAALTTDHLAAGWSLTFCVRTAALGRDVLAAKLAQMGHSLDRKTVAAALLELADLGVIERTGQLDDWVDPSEQDAAKVRKSGAFVYRLAVRLRQVGELADEAAAGWLDWLLSLEVSLGGSTRAHRAQACLRWAIQHAREGTRNAVGFWLGRRCRDSGLTEVEAEPLMGSYAASVTQTGHPYTLREARQSLRSAYRSR